MIEDEIRELLDVITVKKRRNYSNQLRALNLHIGQDQLLCRLSQKDGVTQSQLSESLNCEPPTIANTVKSLETYGLIERKRDGKDGRVNRVYLTEKGKKIIAPVKEVWQYEQDKLLEGMTSEELVLLKNLLKKMENNLV